MQTLRIICPNGHLGFAPLRTESFQLGVSAAPDYIAADSGSDDVGPVPLGSDTSTSPLAWQRHDLEQMLLASRKLGVPMIIGSAGDTGSNSRVDLYVAIIRELAAQHGLKKFRLGWFYSEVDKAYLRRRMQAGEIVQGLDGYADLVESELDATDRIVAMAGVHPYVELLRRGADVIIGGRSSDAALFAAAALHHGFPADTAYYLGKVLECASFCAEPYGGKETVLGVVSHDDVKVTAMLPAQRCTVASVAGHAMYERSNPYEELFAGGRLEMTECRYEQVDERTTRVTGSRFVPSPRIRVKLEGSGKVGERFVGMCGIRDPYTIAHVDEVIDWARTQVRRASATAATSCTTRSTAATASWAISSRCATVPATSCSSSSRASRRRARWPRSSPSPAFARCSMRAFPTSKAPPARCRFRSTRYCRRAPPTAGP